MSLWTVSPLTCISREHLGQNWATPHPQQHQVHIHMVVHVVLDGMNNAMTVIVIGLGTEQEGGMTRPQHADV